MFNDELTVGEEGEKMVLSSTADHDAEVFDIDRLQESCGDDFELEVEVLQEFLGSASGMLETLGAALQNHDVGQVRFQAHTLKGCSRTIGAELLAATCEEIERLSRSGDLPYNPGLFEQAQLNFERLAPILQQYCQKAAA